MLSRKAKGVEIFIAVWISNVALRQILVQCVCWSTVLLVLEGLQGSRNVMRFENQISNMKYW